MSRWSATYPALAGTTSARRTSAANAFTPTGDYTTLSYTPGRVTAPLGDMYNPVYFIGTIYAIHGDTQVPLKSASHGCVRIPLDIAAFFHTLVPTPGTPVYIRRK